MFTCEPTHTCHRSSATRKDFLSTAVFASKYSAEWRRAVEMVAAGQGKNSQRMQQEASAVDFGEHPDHIHPPGPNAVHYEQFRGLADAHLIFHAFWNIQHFCVFQMLMRDPMRQVDLGAIVHLTTVTRAMLRKFQTCVGTVLGMPALAVRKVPHRLECMLAKRSSAAVKGNFIVILGIFRHF